MASIGRKIALIGLVSLAMMRPVLTAEGPKFQIVNKTKKSILFGSVAAYFYDKKGKQLSTFNTNAYAFRVRRR